MGVGDEEMGLLVTYVQSLIPCYFWMCLLSHLCCSFLLALWVILFFCFVYTLSSSKYDPGQIILAHGVLASIAKWKGCCRHGPGDPFLHEAWAVWFISVSEVIAFTRSHRTVAWCLYKRFYFLFFTSSLVSWLRKLQLMGEVSSYWEVSVS